MLMVHGAFPKNELLMLHQELNLQQTLEFFPCIINADKSSLGPSCMMDIVQAKWAIIIIVTWIL